MAEATIAIDFEALSPPTRMRKVAQRSNDPEEEWKAVFHLVGPGGGQTSLAICSIDR